MTQREAAISREILHQEGFYPEESSGLFVGISTFEDERFAPVRFAVDDAVDLAWVFSLELGLLDSGRCVLALTGEPQKEISRQRLEELQSAGARREVPRLTKVYRLVTELSQAGGERGIFVFTGATHGLSEQGGDYLVAADTRRDRLLKTGIEVKDLFDSAGTAIARRRLLLLDACRERLSQGTKSIVDVAMSQSFAGAIAKATGLTVLSGSTAGGFAYDDTKKQNGVFSGAVVEGLKGAARADDRGFITISTLADYVQEQVQTWVRQNRNEHLKKSGIECRFAGAAATLPLAIDPQRSRAIEEYQRRRALALVRLHENIGEILDGHSFEDIKAFLPSSGSPSPEAKELLAEIEALDGSKRSQRSLLHLFGELRAPAPRPPRQAQRWVLGVASLALAAGTFFGTFFGVPWLLSSNSESDRPQQATAEPPAPVSLEEAKKAEPPGQQPAGAEATKSKDAAAAKPKVAAPPPQQSLLQSAKENHKPGELGLDHFGIHYRWIPGDTYTIGSPLEDKERFSGEGQRQITINGFWLAETEVTQAFWAQQGLKNPSRFSGCVECPVENVSWYEAVAFANRLSQQAGLESCYELSCRGELGTPGFESSKAEGKKSPCGGYRLPTEEEWEVAARAQTPGGVYKARYGELGAVAWYDSNSGDKTHPVGEKDAPNFWGLHDMLGNVWEWTNSPKGLIRIYRGGSWYSIARFVRAASRRWFGPDIRLEYLGFRFSLGQLRSGQDAERGQEAGAERRKSE